MKGCAICGRNVKVVMIPDAVGKGLSEAYECPAHGVVTDTKHVRAKCLVKLELEVEVEYDTEEYTSEYISDSLSILLKPQDEEDEFTIRRVTCKRSDATEELFAYA
jgi:hypothetical protein